MIPALVQMESFECAEMVLDHGNNPAWIVIERPMKIQIVLGVSGNGTGAIWIVLECFGIF